MALHRNALMSVLNVIYFDLEFMQLRILGEKNNIGSARQNLIGVSDRFIVRSGPAESIKSGA